jgi:adenylate kinase
MQEVADVELVVNLKLREEALIAKRLGCCICSQCGGNFNLAGLEMEESSSATHIFMPPLLPSPSCASKMTTLADDTEEVVQRRLHIDYEEVCSLNLGH